MCSPEISRQTVVEQNHTSVPIYTEVILGEQRTPYEKQEGKF